MEGIMKITCENSTQAWMARRMNNLIDRRERAGNALSSAPAWAYARENEVLGMMEAMTQARRAWHDLLPPTDPYGELTWAIGSADDFICFDFNMLHNVLHLHAVINSETSSFIEDFAHKVVINPTVEAAQRAAEVLVDMALEWCAENDVEHDRDGWNQHPAQFVAGVVRYVHNMRRKS
jgi:hypothetical protein